MANCFLVGFGPGVGQATARTFHEAGFQLALFGRNPERHLGHLQGLQARAYTADASRPGQLGQALRQALQDLGAPEVLVYNAVSFRAARPSELTPSRFATTSTPTWPVR